MERATRLELAIYSLGRKYSTTELRPHYSIFRFAKMAPTRKPARTALAARHRFLVSTSGANAPSACLYARRGALNYARIHYSIFRFVKTAPTRKPARTALAARHRFLVSTSGANAPSACLYARRGALNYARIHYSIFRFVKTAPPRKTVLPCNFDPEYKNKTRSPRVLFYNNSSYFAIDASSINKIITCSPSLAL